MKETSTSILGRRFKSDGYRTYWLQS